MRHFKLFCTTFSLTACQFCVVMQVSLSLSICFLCFFYCIPSTNGKLIFHLYSLLIGAYGKAGNRNETKTRNGNWKRKLETEMGTKKRTNHWVWQIMASYPGRRHNSLIPTLHWLVLGGQWLGMRLLCLRPGYEAIICLADCKQSKLEVGLGTRLQE